MKLISDYSKAYLFNSSYAAVKIAKNNPTERNVNFATHLLKIKMAKHNEEKNYKYKFLYREMEQIRNNNRLDTAKNILKEVRNIYKGSNYKSANKLRMNRTIDEHMECSRRLDIVREKETLHESLVKSIALKTGNCGELARVAYALCHVRKLSPKLNSYETSDKSFNHAVCQVIVGGKKYIIDPWANLFCEEKHLIEELVNKAKLWENKDKIVLAGAADLQEAYRDPSTLGSAKVTTAQILDLKLTSSTTINGKHNIVTPEFFSQLRKISVEPKKIRLL
ncbi:hypothetical protein [Yersinia proxima]|uniref:hypothetical protein n=1 Tax=Yersinia proxima TaxID=2890316 RepID=UPI001D11DBB7|nr:hypothetical protein [Yersinia proxima]